MLDGTSLIRCFAAVLEDIQASNFANIELLIINGSVQPGAVAPPPPPLPARLLKRLRDPRTREGTLWDVYSRWDRRNKLSPDPFESVDCAGMLAGIDTITVDPIVKGFTHRFPAGAVADIRRRDLDVVLRFGFNIIRGDILSAARYGVWSYHHGDNDFYRGGPPHFWEMVERHPLSGVILQVLSEELDAGLVLCKSLFPTRSLVSWARNGFGPSWGSQHFVIWKLNELHRLGWEALKAKAVKPAAYKGRKKIYRRPTNTEISRWMGPAIVRKAAASLRPGQRNGVLDWRAGIRTGEPLFRYSGDVSNLAQQVSWIPNPPGRFYADPCLFQKDGRTWLFLEDFDYNTGQARIGVAPIQPGGQIGEITPVLERPYHFSYPIVFEYDGDVFMLPETGAEHRVELYRAASFPFQWKLEKVLHEGFPMVDTTPLLHNGKWYFFTSLEHPGDYVNNALLFQADSLTDPWELHPASPISADVRNSRGGGAIIRNGARLIRPTQDCSRCYGYGFTLHEITTLNEAEFSEQSLLTLNGPDLPGLAGTHTYGYCDGVEVIDGSKRLSREQVMALRD